MTAYASQNGVCVIFTYNNVSAGIMLEIYSKGMTSPLYNKADFAKMTTISELNKKLNKVAGITIYFWLMKILATTLGEIFGDFCSMTLQAGYTVSLAITSAFLLLALTMQLRADRFHAALYWLVIVSTTTVGKRFQISWTVR